MKPKYTKHIFICVNERPEDSPKGSCFHCGGMDVRLKFVELIHNHGLKGTVRANKSGCLDVCEMDTGVVIYPANIWYTGVKEEDAEEIFNTSILGDGKVERLAATAETWRELTEIRERKKPV